ncbi:MAG: dockerin type I repeat-containing protein [Clostridia bacterium]|nr:dockerin type I repeat-containing protein [Clostridia bacterium]
MRKTTKLMSLILALVMAFSLCSGFSASAAPKLVSLKITSVPEQLKFYRGTDWDYGTWDQPDDFEPWVWVPGSRISFLRNPGSGYYQETGMINATGLVIEVGYSDGSTKTIKYRETLKEDGTYTQNIILSPENGVYKVGKIKIEVWLLEDNRYYDTYEIEIIDSSKPTERQKGDVNNDLSVNSSDALLVLQYAVSLVSFDSTQKRYADMNNDGKYNSADALAILQTAVGK